MPAGTLAVAAGEKVVLSLSNAASRGAEVVKIRPKTPLALKALAGTAPALPVRLADPNLFEIVQNATGLSPLRPDTDGRIGGLDGTLVKAVIATVPTGPKMPSTVRLHQKARGRPLPHAAARTTTRRVDVGAVVRVIDYVLPEWLKDLRMYLELLRLKEIDVAANATLVIDGSITLLTSNNVIIHTGGRIVSQARQLTMDVTGKFQGDVP